MRIKIREKRLWTVSHLRIRLLGYSIIARIAFRRLAEWRSGLALKHAITMPNAPGTIDPGYRGEVRVILLNLGREVYTVRAGDRIAQMIVARYEAVEWVEGDLADSQRGIGGFGSSGR